MKVNKPRPYVRAFVASGIWFAAVAVKMLSRHPGGWETYPARNYAVLMVAFLLTALVVGFAAAHLRKLQSWLAIGIATVAGCFVTIGLMLITVEKLYGFSAPPKFKTANEMMTYIAAQTTKWVKADRGIDLDYSFDSVKVVEKELARISTSLNKINPPQGTFGVATGYGAYIGEVFWAALRRFVGGGSSCGRHSLLPSNYAKQCRDFSGRLVLEASNE